MNSTWNQWCVCLNFKKSRIFHLSKNMHHVVTWQYWDVKEKKKKKRGWLVLFSLGINPNTQLNFQIKDLVWYLTSYLDSKLMWNQLMCFTLQWNKWLHQLKLLKYTFLNNLWVCYIYHNSYWELSFSKMLAACFRFQPAVIY